MAEFKGTPEQWRVESDERVVYVISDDPNPPHHGTIICEMDNGNQEIERDARLISAAPDLLEALEAMSNEFAEICNNVGLGNIPEENWTFKKAEKAIMKAYGCDEIQRDIEDNS
ncbi:hypothetical protein [Bacteroides reticulotermitis]|uniref:hypothetical protein n=1 Tax=Bacteroides reticulotermitis TaxID=1133319 RepID=UPI003A8A3B73